MVKTAIAGEDPNWGRVVMAVGKSGEAADRDRLSIWFGDILVAERWRARAGYVEKTRRRLHEAAGDRHPRRCRRRQGAAPRCGPATSPHDYIAINADYRT